MPPVIPFDPFAAAFQIIWIEENGGDKISVVDVPGDPGALTIGGVALSRHPDLVEAQVRKWTKPDFARFYRANYWAVANCDQLPWPVSYAVFDGEVNEGAEGALALQAALGLKTDGNIGPVTVRAAAHYGDTAANLAANVCWQRELAYRKLSTFSQFGHGWIVRMYAGLFQAGSAQIVQGV